MNAVPMPSTRPLRILIAALGGQGGGVLAEWLVDAARQAGFVAQSTSIPGVAQRTGATTYYVELFPEPIARLGGRRPVLGLYPVPGAIDLIVASELLEATRVVQAGMASPDRTCLIASSSRTLTTAEKMALGDGRYSSEQLIAVARAQSRVFIAFDMDALASEAGTVVSAVMLGAVAGSGVLPIPRETCEAVIRAAGVGVEGSLRGFAAGFAAVAEGGRGVAAIRRVEGVPLAPERAIAGADAASSAATALPARATGEWPPGIAGMVALGEARVAEFQDTRYAALFAERVRAVLAAETGADPQARHDHALTRETARFLALWMAFDDIVRVADLKCRASRFARVRREVNAGNDDLVRIVDYFKPGIPEFAGVLPPAWARRVLRLDARRRARGRPPWSFALHLRSDSISGYILLRLLAGLRGARRRGARYAEEQLRIERWLDAVRAGTGEDWALGYELALCGRLIKGYGETNERSKRNLAHILEHLASAATPASVRAAAVREAREAALADEGGKELDSTLMRHGVPPRPVVAQPVQWVRQRRTKPPARAVSDVQP